MLTGTNDRIQVWVLDGTERAAEIAAFTRIEAFEEDLKVGAWSVVIDQGDLAGSNVLNAVKDATWLGIEIYDNDTGWRFSGPAVNRGREYGDIGVVNGLEIGGVDDMDYLASLLNWPNVSDPDLWWQDNELALPLSVAAGNEVGVNGQFRFNEQPARAIPDLVINDPATPLGPIKTWLAAGQPLTDLLRPWHEETAFTCRLALWRDTNGTAERRFEVTERGTSPHIVTPGSHGSIRIDEVAAGATWVSAIGALDQSFAGDVVRFTANNGIPETNWLTRRRERHISRPTLETESALLNEIEAELNANAPIRRINAPDFDLPGYGNTTKLGDYITINFDLAEDGSTEVPIKSSRLLGTPDGWTRSISIGRDVPTGPRLFEGKYQELQRRLRRLEGHVR